MLNKFETLIDLHTTAPCLVDEKNITCWRETDFPRSWASPNMFITNHCSVASFFLLPLIGYKCCAKGVCGGLFQLFALYPPHLKSAAVASVNYCIIVPLHSKLYTVFVLFLYFALSLARKQPLSTCM